MKETGEIKGDPLFSNTVVHFGLLCFFHEFSQATLVFWNRKEGQNPCLEIPKMEPALFVSSKLTFPKNLRYLNFSLLVGAISQKRSLSSTCFVIAGQSIYSGKFKHLEYSKSVNFEGKIVLITFR